MKKNLFITLILALIVTMVPSVKADCVNVLPSDYKDNLLWPNAGNSLSWQRVYINNGNKITLEPNKTYTFFATTKLTYNRPRVYVNDTIFVDPVDSYTFTTSDTVYIYDIRFAWKLSYDDFLPLAQEYFSTNDFFLVEGSEVCTPVELDPAPDPAPDPDPVIESELSIILTNFYNIYTSKIQQIAQYSLENKFILGAIAIVFLFVVLNFFLYLFKVGGYKR